MKSMHNMEGVRLVAQDPFNAPPPQRQVWVCDLGDFWGEAMATALLSLCFLAGMWSGFSVNRLRKETEMAQREAFRAERAREHNAAEQRRVRGERIHIILFSVFTLGVWWLLRGRPWPRPQLRPVDVSHILPVMFSPQGLDWLLDRGYIRRESQDNEWFIYPEPKLVRETRYLWDPLKDED